MANSKLRIGIIGCGRAARVHVGRLTRRDDVEIVGLADTHLAAAEDLAETVSKAGSNGPPRTFADYRELLGASPDAVAIFTPHLSHYRPAMDALQAGCHVFIERPLSTNVQEAADIVSVARARSKVVAVGHQYRLCPSFVEAKRRLSAGAVGAIRLVTCTLAQPWLAGHSGPADNWRLDPKVAGGGILADTGDHLLDALLWTTERTVQEVSAVQNRPEKNLDAVTAAAVRLDGNLPATIAVTGMTPGTLFALEFFGEAGRLRATDRELVEVGATGESTRIDVGEPQQTIDGDFVTSVLAGGRPCCPAEEAVETVRLLEAITRSSATGQSVRLT